MKYNGNLCHIQNLNVKDVNRMNSHGTNDVNPKYDRMIRSIPKHDTIVPTRYIIASNHGINFKDINVILCNNLFITFFLNEQPFHLSQHA